MRSMKHGRCVTTTLSRNHTSVRKCGLYHKELTLVTPRCVTKRLMCHRRDTSNHVRTLTVCDPMRSKTEPVRNLVTHVTPLPYL